MAFLFIDIILIIWYNVLSKVKNADGNDFGRAL